MTNRIITPIGLLKPRGFLGKGIAIRKKYKLKKMIRIKIEIPKEYFLDFRKTKSQPINLKIGKHLIKCINLPNFILRKILKMFFNLTTGIKAIMAIKAIMETKATKYSEKNKNNRTDMSS